jgi:hypothetical protein
MAIALPALPPDHLEQLSQAASVFTLNPFKNTLFYLFPHLGAHLSGYQELESNLGPGSDQKVAAVTQEMLKEFRALRKCARARKTVPYVALHYGFGYYGGSYSLTRPVLLIPEQYLFRRAGRQPFTQEQPNEEPSRWILSDHEVRFCIARELGQIKEDNALLRIAIKVCLIAAVFAIYATPLGWTLGVPLVVGALGLYIASERFFQARADQIGVEILGRRLKNRPTALKIAINVLEKQRLQNLHWRDHALLGKFYITPLGVNQLDFLRPNLLARIAHLRRML